MVFPTLNSFYLSFFSYDLVSAPRFIGFRNYQWLLSDRVFQWSFVVTFIYVFGSAVPTIVLALLSALILNQAMAGRDALRAIFFLPSVMSLVAVAIIFTGLFNSQGVVNYYLRVVLGQDKVIPWLSEMPSALYAIITARIWRSFGFYMVIFLAGLQNIPTEYYEAAIVDGVSRWKRLVHITLPLLTPTTVVVSLLTVVNSFQAFTVPYIMTQGGPAQQTSILPIQLYHTAFRFFRMGRACAISVVIFVILSVFAALQFRVAKRYAQ